MTHLLKRLELTGFKSFANRTVLEFPAGITAIVGPNGSGKSNVIDAIRWILGEREARNLRGGKAEDLIFAGTPKKPRTGQARAIVQLDNSSKAFPIDFTEVVVERRIDRSGTSKYFINTSEVRLKDIIDFFVKARLGTKGLVVITQGNNDVFVRATPDGRREMIEEMLGLREYQIKKFDAERRLRNSQINLDKTKALIEEIAPHLRLLRRQTKRWEKREELEGKLKELENKLFGQQLRSLKESISALQREIDTDGGELAKLEGERKKAQEELHNIETTLPKEREELIALRKRIQELISHRSILEKEIGRLEAHVEIMEQTEENTIQTASELFAGLKDIKRQLAEALTGDSFEIIEIIKSVLDDINRLLGIGKEKHRAKPQPAFTRLNEIKSELETLERKMTDLREKEKHLEGSQDEFYQSFKAAAGKLGTVRDNIRTAENKHQSKILEKERLEIRLSEVKRQIEQAGRFVDEFLTLTRSDQEKEQLSESHLKEIEQHIFRLRGNLASIGEIDEALLSEARQTEERYQFLTQQVGDLERAKADLEKLIDELTKHIKTEFSSALVKINKEFNTFFELMFGGGHARLKVEKKKILVKETGTQENGQDSTNKNHIQEERGGGIEIDVNLPRKRINSLDVLSGGEKSLVGIAALFALVSVSPPPFLVLDEIDAALDEKNSHRFAEMLAKFSKDVQFVIVTHNRAVMEAANVLYGVTLGEDGTSKIVSLHLGSPE